MLPENQRKTNIGVGIGIVLQILGRVLAQRGGVGSLVALGLIVVGLFFFVWGCMNYAEGKGYTKWLGLLGLFSCFGLIVLVFLPDRHKSPR